MKGLRKRACSFHSFHSLFLSFFSFHYPFQTNKSIHTPIHSFIHSFIILATRSYYNSLHHFLPYK